MTSAAQQHVLPGADAFRLRAGNFSILVLRLLDGRPEVVLPALGDQFRRAPGFLRFAPIAIGLDDLNLTPAEIDFPGLIAGLRGLDIVPMGVVGGSPALRQAAAAAGLSALRPSGAEKEIEQAPAPAPAEPPAPRSDFQGSGRTAMIVTQPVRSGSRIYAEGADLIITSTVNPGAEVIADGNIHVYGALRGRAVAGAADNPDARVFALNFDPELIAIAGLYAVREGLTAAPIGRTVMVRLDGESLRFEKL
ncbi:septum site-determining protein MinC [Rhodovarius crocodyli]|uniref:Probable septum site-determining protein MinC n=1 Tax=Rhodovarius crocodyli TaxID=1979269 RepID=A0A437MHF9_9PROT|nr:septum site-determining protein MinC [Rhodovarius crocodyli]RVT97088.1 septum site-determining protein MinC [Rhodovarius crocodyli]